MSTSDPSSPLIPRKRRPNHSGSEHVITRVVKGKTYTYHRVTGYISLDGKQLMVAASGKTLAEAHAALSRKMTREQVALGILGSEYIELDPTVRKQTTATMLQAWLNSVQPRLRVNAYKLYESKVRNYLIPDLGDTPIRLLTHEQLSHYFSDTLPGLKKADGTPRLGTTTQRQIYNILQDAINHAIKLRKLDHSPLAAVYPPQKRRQSHDEIQVMIDLAKWVPQQIVKVVHGQPNELRWLLGLHGLRQAEVLGLTDDSIHWKSKTNPDYIVIKQQLDRRTASHGCGKYDPATRSWPCGKQSDQCPKTKGESEQFIRPETKTLSSRRELPLSPELKATLLRHLKYREQLREGDEWSPLPGPKMDSLIFTKSNGHPIRPQDDRAAFNKVVQQAGSRIPHLRVHDLRHFAATIAVQDGMARDKIAMIFGWSPRHVDEMIMVYSAHDKKRLIESDVNRLGEILNARLPDTE